MSRHVTRMFCAAAGFALAASGLATACAASTGTASTGTAGPRTAGTGTGTASTASTGSAARASLAGGTAQSVITCCSLSGVAATSGGNAWAVGRGGPGTRTAVLHWNGTAWTRVPSPGPAYSSVAGVAVVSAGDAWAVGSTSSRPGRYTPLILHWNGTAWKQVPSPNPSADSMLDDVAATSADDAWAVGTTGTGPLTCGSCTPLILHWNGTTWKQVPGPNLPAGRGLDGVSAPPADDGWAVGYIPGLAGSPLILHWNGTTWTRAPSPSLGHVYSTLAGVAASSAHSAWAVGLSGDS